MNDMLEQLLDDYSDAPQSEREQAIREVVQELVLYGLSSAGFFNKAAFIGGTALRIFHGLKRYSEDLDFMLMQPGDFNFNDYLPLVRQRLSVFGLNLEVKEKERKNSDIIAGLAVANTKELYLAIYSEDDFSRSIYRTQTTKIKIEIGKHFSDKAGYRGVVKTKPFIHAVTLCDLPTLFAGKIHAILFRKHWGKVKGRDLFDFVFYVRRHIPFNLDFLNDKIKTSNESEDEMIFDDVVMMLKDRFKSIDYELAKTDVKPFLNEDEVRELDYWSPDYFIKLTEEISCQGELIIS